MTCDLMPIFYTSQPLGCVIQCGTPRDEDGQRGGLYLAVLATGLSGRNSSPRRHTARRAGQVFRFLGTETVGVAAAGRRVQLMHFDVDRWRIRVIGEANKVGSITERVLERDYVLEEVARG